MSRPLLIVRPQPGADATAGRAREKGFDVRVHPIFVVEPVPWDGPDPARFDALMLTSANAPRHAGPALLRYAALPTWCVGASTAKAAREAGLNVTAVGNGDVASLWKDIRAAGCTTCLHLSGEDIRPYPPDAAAITRVPVYASVEQAADLMNHLETGMVVMIHSARAGSVLRQAVPPQIKATIDLVAISDAALADTGEGWSSKAAAPQPNDRAMLVIAHQLCHAYRP